MKIVIQCAATKNQGPLNFGFKSSDGRAVKFVAHPELALSKNDFVYARPDDLGPNGKTWREVLVEYNEGNANPDGLLQAHKLYSDQAYQNLVNKFGLDTVFILSAGWGLISGSFLIPDYDITFSNAPNVQSCSKRKKNDSFNDFCQLPDDEEEILYLGGKDYPPLFRHLTSQLKAKKILLFKTKDEPFLPAGFTSKRFITTRSTNWHYTAAQALVDGDILI